MTQDELPPYEPWVEELLEAERKVPALPEALQERLLQRLLLDPPVAADSGPADDGGSLVGTEALPSAVASKAALTTGLLASAKLTAVVSGAVGLLLGAAVGATGYAALVPPKERIVTRVEVREVQVPVVMPQVLPDAAVSTPSLRKAPIADAGVAPRASARRNRPSEKPEPSALRDTELADENALITRAQNALARGRADEALAATREHERSFARGRFVEEREALTIQALAKQGNMPEAKARAERFYQRYPNSLLTRLVRAVVKAP